MRSIAKASSARSNQRQASGLGRILRGAFATRGASIGLDGSGAPSVARATGLTGTRRPAIVLGTLAGALLLAAALAPARAAAAPPTTFWDRCATESAEDVGCLVPRGIATAPATAPAPGDVYVADQGGKRVAELTPWGVLVRAWGRDVVAEGPGESGEGFEICEPAAGDVCKAGESGGGAGEFASPQGVAVDSAGNVYVVDRPNRRVQKFDPEGNFLRMWGKEVNGGSSGNPDLCTNAGPPGEECQAGAEGAEAGQFGAWTALGSYVSVDTKDTPSAADDTLYIGDAGRIQSCNTEGEACAALPDPEGLMSGKKVRSLATHANGPLYLAREGTAGIIRLNPATGMKECEGTAANPTALAAAAGIGLFANDQPMVRRFALDCAGAVLPETVDGTYPFDAGFPTNPTGLALGTACYTAPAFGLYGDRVEGTNLLRAWGPAPDKTGLCPPVANPPAIEAQYASAVGEAQATVQADINPLYWDDATYFLQHASAACIEAEGWGAPCVTQTATTPLGGGVVNEAVQTAKLALGGLSPGTEYRYRFTAQSSGGGPAVGAERALTTRLPIGPDTACPNQELRFGPAALLPDCRAYEMVSPVDKNGGEIVNENEDGGIHDAYIQASPDGNRIAYSAAPAFGDQLASKFYNQYLATRGGDWSNEGINAPLGEQTGGVHYIREVGAFSADLCNMWFADYNVFPINPDGQPDHVNLYRRQNCEPGRGGFETLTTAALPEGTVTTYVDRDSAQGLSGDGNEAFFVAEAKLTADAAGTDRNQVYLHLASDPLPRPPHLVSILPSGVAASPAAGSEVGSAAGGEGNLRNAVSADGHRVFWTAHAIGNTSAGQIYLRLNPAQAETSEEEGGACVPHPTLACTIPVSAGGGATFWAAAKDGSAAIYTEGSFESGAATLWRFDTATRTRTKLAEGVRGVPGASDDLARIYLASTKALDAGASEGQPNLYLLEGASAHFIGTLLSGDASGITGPGEAGSYNVVSQLPRFRATRVSPDGAHIVFQSRAELTGFDSHDAETGEPSLEVFAYDAEAKGGEGELLCVSCNPAGARPQAGELAPPYIYPRLVEVTGKTTGIPAAAWIPTWEHPLHASRILSEDGNRVFFHSFDPLVPHDTNGVQDVYQWEAPGAGSCDSSDADYFASNGGCLSLISSGQSPFESEFFDASADGGDVFFTTEESLVDRDPGSIDLYDARAGGGVPEPGQASECEGEACQSPPPPPPQAPRASTDYSGPGNLGPDCRAPARRAAGLARRAKRLRAAARRARAPRRSRALRRRSARLARKAAQKSKSAKRCRRAARRAAR